MNEVDFWEIIAKAHGDADTLIETLAKLPPAEIIQFDRIVSEKVRDAFRWDLWAVAHLMNGGCSDDGFDYFLTWLIARGRDAYEAALADPARAADGCNPDDEPFENEMLWWAPARAYGKATNGDPDALYQHDQRVSRTIRGKPWEENELRKLYPKLAERFG
jgi:hypothetical protein